MLGKDVVEGLAKSVRHLRHIQITGMPGGNAANSGMVDYTAIFQILIDLNYDWWIGCECHPLGKNARQAWMAHSLVHLISHQFL